MPIVQFEATPVLLQSGRVSKVKNGRQLGFDFISIDGQF